MRYINCTLVERESQSSIDVVTTGGSSLLAVDRIQEFGCQVVQVVGVCDRLQGGAENFAARALPFKSLLTVEDLGVKLGG